jgi:hypothetical protein
MYIDLCIPSDIDLCIPPDKDLCIPPGIELCISPGIALCISPVFFIGLELIPDLVPGEVRVAASLAVARLPNILIIFCALNTNI